MAKNEKRDDKNGRFAGDIERFLRETIEALEPIEEERDGPGRPRILPALCLWAGVLVCVLRGFSSQLAVWRLLSLQRLWFYPRFPVSDQAVYNRLASGGTAGLEKLFAQISAVLQERLAPYVRNELAPFAKAVVAIDETTLDPIARLLPSLRDVPPGDDRLLPGKLAGIFDIRRQQWLQVQHVVEPHQNEKVMARSLLESVEPGSLVVGDLGYFGFKWFDDLTDGGYWWISRLRARTSYKVIHANYQQGDIFDGLVWLGAYRADKGAHAVRLVTFQVGKQTHRYISNVLNPEQLSAKEIATLYARRWDIELAFKLVKRHLKLHLLWSSKTEVILQQVWAVLTIAQILHALQMEIAGLAHVDPYDVSLALLVEYIPQLAYDSQDPIQLIVEHGRHVRFIRPSSRIRIRAPNIPLEKMAPLPADTVLVRQARYAQRNCHRRPRKN